MKEYHGPKIVLGLFMPHEKDYMQILRNHGTMKPGILIIHHTYDLFCPISYKKKSIKEINILCSDLDHFSFSFQLLWVFLAIPDKRTYCCHEKRISYHLSFFGSIKADTNLVYIFNCMKYEISIYRITSTRGIY